MKYVIERQYLMPVYQQLIVEADTPEEACRLAVDFDDWGNHEIDPHPLEIIAADACVDDAESSQSTTISGIREIPAETHSVESVLEVGLGNYLWEDPIGQPPRLAIPEEFTEEVGR